MLHRFFNKCRNTRNLDEKQLLLLENDYLSLNLKFRNFQTEDKSISRLCVDDVWNIILSYFSEFSDFEKMSLISYSVVFNYLGKNHRLSTLLLNTALAHTHIDQLNSAVNQIIEDAKNELGTVVANERNKSKFQKKSIWARAMKYAPGSTMLGFGIKYLITAMNVRSNAQSFLDSVLWPTCTAKPDKSTWRWPRITNEIILICADYSNYKMYGDDCDYWNTGQFVPEGCDTATCQSACAELNAGVAMNNFKGGWLVADGGLALIIAACIPPSYFNELDETSIDKICKKSFGTISNPQFIKNVSMLLEMKESELSKLPAFKVLATLNNKLKAINEWLKKQESRSQESGNSPMNELTSKLFPIKKVGIDIKSEDEKNEISGINLVI